MGTVYVDILVFINTIIGYFVLKCAALIASLPCKTTRLCMGAFTAGISSLLILFNLNDLTAFILKLVSMLVVVAISYNFNNMKLFLKAVVWYVLLNLMFGGICEFAAQNGKLIYDNYSVYIYVPPLLIVICVLFMYFIITSTVQIFGRPKPEDKVTYTLDVQGEKRYGVAMLDTGFSVRDNFTGNAVVLLSKPFPQVINDYYESGAIAPGMRLIPVITATGECLLPSVNAEISLDKKCCKTVTAAFAHSELSPNVSAIISADLNIYY